MRARRIARIAGSIFAAAGFCALGSCSTGAFTPVLGEFPLNASHENVPLRFELSPEMLRRPVILDVRGAKNLEAMKTADAQVVLRIRNDGQHPVRIGVLASNGSPSSVDLPPGWMATAFTGSVSELITTSRQTGTFFATGDDPHVSMTAIFSNIAAFKRDMPLVVRMAPVVGPR